MKFRMGLPLLAISAVVVTGGVWLIGRALGPTGNGALETHAAALDEVHEPDLTEGALYTPQTEHSFLEGNRRVAERTAWPVPEDSIWLEGRVVFPPDTPADEELRVVAWGRRFSGKGNRHSYEMAPDPDGRFRVAFAEGTRTGRLRLAARYLYLKHGLSLKMRELPHGIVLEPLVGGHLSVRVNLPPGVDPVELDTLTVYAFLGRSADGQPPSSRQSAEHEDGVFELSGMPPGSDVQLRTMSPTLCDGEFSVESLQAGETREATITLTRGVRLAGRVVAADGSAVHGAQLKINRGIVSANPSAKFILPTDERGVFEIPAARPGRITLRATHTDHLDGVLDLGTLANGAVIEDLQLRMGQGDGLEGIVQWPDGSPAIEAWVEVRSEAKHGLFFDESRADASTRTLSDGGFHLTGLEDGDTYHVRARARPESKESDPDTDIEGKAPRVRTKGPYWHAEQRNVQRNSTSLVLVLGPGSPVVGRVVDASGAAVESFSVKLKRGKRTPRAPGYRDISKKFYSSDGQFRIDGVPVGHWTVTVTSKSHAKSRPVSVWVPQKWSLTIVTPREARVSGLVLDPGGRGIEGARIEAERDDGWGGDTTSDRAEENGRFEFALAPGKYKIKASMSKHAASEPTAIEISPGGHRSNLVLRLRLAGRITGVVDPSLGTVAGRHLYGNHLDPQESDSQGRFEFDELAPGTYEIFVFPEIVEEKLVRNSSLGVRVELEEGQTRHVVLGGAPVDPIRVFGRVSEADKPFAGAQLVFRSEEAAYRTENDSNGGYELVVDGAGHYTVMIGTDRGDLLYYEVEVPRGVGSFERDFQVPTGRLTGRLLGPDGEPVERGIVTLIGQDGSGQAVRSDYEGQFSFLRLRAGIYTLQGQGAQSSFGLATGYGHALLGDLKVDEGQGIEGLEVHLPRAATIEGIVLTQDGLPVGDAEIHVLDASGRSLILRPQTRTDHAGRYTCRGVGPGTFRVLASKSERVGDWREVTVPEGETVSVDLVLDG